MVERRKRRPEERKPVERIVDPEPTDASKPRADKPVAFKTTTQKERSEVAEIQARERTPGGVSGRDALEKKQSIAEAGQNIPIPTQPEQLVAPAGTPEREAQIETALGAEGIREDVFLNPRRVRIENDIAALEGAEDLNPLEQVRLARLEFRRNRIEAIQNVIIAVGATSEGKAFGVVDDILADREGVIAEKQSSITTYHGLTDDVGDEFQNGEISYAEAVAQLDEMKNIIDNIEDEIQNEAILSPAARTSGALTDVEGDLFEFRRKWANNRRIVEGLTEQNI